MYRVFVVGGGRVVVVNCGVGLWFVCGMGFGFGNRCCGGSWECGEL